MTRTARATRRTYWRIWRRKGQPASWSGYTKPSPDTPDRNPGPTNVHVPPTAEPYEMATWAGDEEMEYKGG